MNQTIIDKEQQKLEQVEKYGILLEQFGFQRMAGRIIGLLILSDPPHKTFDEIREYLQASKSSVSTALQVLEIQKLVSYFTLPGDRKRYFRFNAENLIDVMKKDFNRTIAIKDILKETFEIRGNENDSFNKSLKRIAEFYEFVGTALPQLFKEWEEKNPQ